MTILHTTKQNLLILILLLFTQISLSAKVLYTHQQATQILNQQKIQQTLNSLFKVKNTNSHSKQINEWIEDPSMEPLYKEKLLYETTLIFRESDKNPINTQIMEKLLTYKSEAYLPMTDGGRMIEIVVFQVAASAKATLSHWEINNSYHNAAELLLSNPDLFIAHLITTDLPETSLTGYIKAINHAPVESLMTITNRIKSSQQKLPVHALLAMANVTSDKDLYRLLIEQYRYNNKEQAAVLKALGRLPESFTSDETINLLLLATSSDGLGNSAVLAMSRYVDSFVKVQEFMLSKLNDPQLGGAAALALGNSKDLLTVERLSNNLQSNDLLLRRRSILALHYIDSLQANNILKTFKNSTTNQQLKEEIGQWLN